MVYILLLKCFITSSVSGPHTALECTRECSATARHTAIMCEVFTYEI